MIPIKYKGSDLIGRKCRPMYAFGNGAGNGITPNTVCTIVDVVRGKGFVIETEKCPHCGQYARISRIPRRDLELIEEENNHA